MKQAQLRLAGLLLLAGVALAGAVAGGYALGAASSKSRVQVAEAPRARGSDEVASLMRQIERRLARLEARGADSSPAVGQGVLAHTDSEAAPARVAQSAESEAAAVLAVATSDSDVLLASQRLVDDVLMARRISEAQKTALRETLPKLSMDDRLAAMNQLSAALNRGEIDFDAREIF